MKLILPLVAFILLTAPTLVSAQGLASFAGCTGTDCSACNVVSMTNELIKWLIGITFMLFAVLCAWAGFGLVTSGGNQGELDAAKDKFTNAIIGLIIILSAWLIVDTIMRGLVGNDENPGSVASGVNAEGKVTGWLYWTDVQCQDQTDTRYVERPTEDVQFSVSSCNNINATAAEITSAGCSITPCTTTSCLTSCMNVRQGVDIGRAPGNYCVKPISTTGSVPAGIVTNPAMSPIFDPAQGGSSMVVDGAAERMQATLAGPFALLQQYFGQTVVINDAIAKAGTSREEDTPGSRHFYGDALDLSTNGMSDADKIRLYESAQRAGFTGFGFGTNILHVDLGGPRAWAYGNSTYGGKSVCSLGVQC
jgi:hypothetical protein